MRVRRATAHVVAVAAAATALAAPVVVAAASPAAADNCEPTEPVVRVLFPNYEEQLIQDPDNPLCYVLRGYVYPRVCDNPTTLLGTCVQTLNPDPAEPVVVQPYAPDGGRVFCSVSNFVLINAGQPAACTSTATGQSVTLQLG